MNIIQIKDYTVSTKEIIPLLDNSRLLPHFLRELILDRAIAEIECTQTDFENCYWNFTQQYQLDSGEKLRNWLQKTGTTEAQLNNRIIRKVKIDKFKQEQWGHELESYFLDRKLALEKAVFSLIRVASQGMARELYHRICEGENTLAELATAYSLGKEANNNGLVGVTKLIDLHHVLAQMLHRSQPGQLLPPKQIEDSWVIVRLEKYLPAKLDDAMRSKLLNELCDRWLSKQVLAIDLNEIKAA